MIRKKVLCISAIFSIMILSRLYSSPNLDTFENPFKQQMLAHAERLQKTKATALYETENEGANELTFASENIPTNRAVVKQKLNTYMARLSYQRQQTHELHHKASKFLPQIAAILKSHGVPEDFKYIPLVESGLDPKITSHKGAGGYWQFMPATARLYGLKVNGSIDERKNFVKSTHAAARYLKSLYQEFGDWTLVAAAYNVGGGSLKASIRRQKQDDYFKLRLNAETGSYVYKLVSMKAVIENPTEHGYRI